MPAPITGIVASEDYRPEVDGLRCIAVAAVILYHAGFSAFSGGFIGVDVFFVISGYLITSIILKDLEHGRFSFARFYERRARRIFPALFLVLFCCLPFAWLWLTPGQLKEFSQSTVAVSGFLSNAYFYLKSGYFGSNAEEVPLLHTWSLSVEEQFYVVFPCVLLLLNRWRVGATLLVLAVCGVLSFGVCVYLEANPQLNFFFSPSRAWELLVGCMLALPLLQRCTARLAQRPVLRATLELLGAAMVVGSVFGLSSAQPYPGRWTVLPVLGTAVLIACSSPTTAVGRVLAARPVVGLGLISYSLYLWHQPLFAFARASTEHEPTPLAYGALISLALLLSYLSWRFVEVPIRRARTIPRKWIFAGSAAAAMGVSAIGVAGHLHDGYPQRFEQYRAGLTFANQSSPLREQCHTEGVNYRKPQDACVYFHPQTPWAVFGDSHSVELAYALAKSLEPRGQGVRHLSFSGCQPALTFRSNVPGCSAWIAESVDYLEHDANITNVVLAFRHSFHTFGDQLKRYPGVPDARPSFLVEQSSAAARNAYWQSFDTIVERLRAAGKTVYVLSPVPELPRSVERYMFKHGSLRQPQIGTSMVYYRERNRSALEHLAQLRDAGRVRYIDSQAAVCNPSECFAKLDDAWMYFDDNHLSVQGAARVVRLWRGPDVPSVASVEVQ